MAGVAEHLGAAGVLGMLMRLDTLCLSGQLESPDMLFGMVSQQTPDGSYKPAIRSGINT